MRMVRGGEERKGICSYDSPMIGQKFSRSGSLLSRSKGRRETQVSDSGHNFFCAFTPYVLHMRHLCTELCSVLGKSLSSESLGESQEGNTISPVCGPVGLDCQIYTLMLMKHYCPRTLMAAIFVNQKPLL